MIDVAEAIDAEAINVVLHRVNAASGTYDTAGRWIPGAPSTVAIAAAVQPVSGRVLMDMPEGVRSEASLVAWSRVSIVFGDHVTVGGVRYQCVHEWPRPADGFCKVALGKVAP